MVELLTSKAFSAYGSVLRNPSEVAIREKLNTTELVKGAYDVKERSVLFQYSENHAVYLEHSADPVLLLLSTDKTFKQRDIFLLDKPVVINPGVLYCLNGLNGCTDVLYMHSHDAVMHQVLASDDGVEPLMLPKVNINKIFTIFYQEKEKGFLFKGETHNFWELTYVDKGYMRSIVDGEEWVLHQGEAMFYDTGQHHMQYSDADVAVCYITITFDMELADCASLCNCKFTIDSYLAQLLDKILYEKEHSIFYSEDLIACYLKEFVIKIIRSQISQKNATGSYATYQYNIEKDLVERTAAYIEQNLSERLTVKEIAAHVNVSQSYLSVLFKRHRKYTLIEYINRVRLEHCKELIREGKYSITQIAELVGYSSVQYLSRQFKSVVGISPSEYIKMKDP